MGTRTTSRRTLAGALAGALACVLAAPIPSPAARGAGDPGFAVAAVGFESYYRYRLDAGEATRGKLRLVSRSRRDQEVVLRAADVTTAENGGLEYGSSAPRSYGRWISIRRRVTLPAGGAIDVPFRIEVERGADPGDHFAGIVALNRRDLRRAGRAGNREGFSLRYLPRLAIAVQVTVPGPAQRELTSGGLTIEIAPAGTAVGLLLRNTGTKLVRRTTGMLELRQGDRVLLRRAVDIDAFVPQTTLRYRLPLTGRAAESTYRVEGELRPRGAPALRIDDTVQLGEKESEELRTETGREAQASETPVWLIVALAAAGLLVLALAFALLSARRRLGRAGDGPRPGRVNGSATRSGASACARR